MSAWTLAEVVVGDDLTAVPTYLDAYGPDLVTNPSAAVNIAGWGGVVGTLTRNASQGWDGNGAFQLVTPVNTAADQSFAQLAPKPAGAAGVTYRFTVRVKGSGTISCQLYSLGLGQFAGSPVVVLSATDYQLVTISGVAPAGTATIYPVIRQHTATGGIPLTFYFDDAHLQPVTNGGIDVAFPNATRRWTATPRAEGQTVDDKVAQLQAELDANGSILGDGLRAATAWDSDHPIAGPTSPWTASFVVVANSMRDLAGVNVGSRVVLTVWDGTPYGDRPPPFPPNTIRQPVLHFIGRVSEMSSRPLAGGRVQVTVQCVDYLADLAELTVGYTEWPSETLAARVTRILVAANVGLVSDVLYGAVARRPAAPTSALELLIETLSWASEGIDYQRYLCVNVPINIAPDGVRFWFGPVPDPALPYKLGTVFKRENHGNGNNPYGLPGVLEFGGLGVTLGLNTDTAADEIYSAAIIGQDVEWSKRRAQRIDRVTVTGDESIGGVWAGQLDAVPIEYTLETEQISTPDITNLSRYLLPESTDDTWGIDELSILEFGDGDAPAWLVAYGQQDAPRRAVVITDVESRQNPDGSDFLVVTVTNARLELAGGGYTVTVEVRPDVPRAAVIDWIGAGVPEPYLSWRNLRASPDFGSIRPTDLDPNLTPYDLRIARKA